MSYINDDKIAFVYHYWNIETLESYYGYKESWDRNYSPFDIFDTHPTTLKNNSGSYYAGSIRQKKWKQDKLDGKIYGEIIAVFTGDGAGDLAHEYEHQMIITHKALYGQETLYNQNDGYAKFSTAGKVTSDETKKKLIEVENRRWARKGEKEKKSKQSKEMWKDPKIRKQIIDGITGKTRTDEQRQRYSDGAKERWKDQEEIAKVGKRSKELWQKPEYKSKFCKIVIQYTIDGDFVAEWPSVREIWRQLKINVSKVCNGKAKTAGGFIWRWKNAC